ncbi:CHASE2 domain-containing protein [Brucepastera parasyntrophica]|uniref:CHASE2 domain-containing protein n=1 Tax=Brucepastera parasyntrophica TaxID=2880008 RepID=UPI00210AA6D7|nr:CHASE2 domain-containing protein [Brucepastera parasyntrophica]ULQ59586.1 CHASE2 domain-containing protein [Brucepastera parasyntrophica]
MKTLHTVKEFLKKKLEYFVALISFLLFFFLSLTTTGRKMEYGLYDTMLGLKPAVSERKDILMLDIDDLAIEEIGAWPWTRDIIADVLIRLKEAGGKTIVFDIEYLSPSQTGVNRNYVKNNFPEEYGAVQNEITGYVDEFVSAVSSRSISLDYVPEVGSELSSIIADSMAILSESISGNIFQDNDLYFGNAIRFFGNTWLTINAEKVNSGNEAQLAADYAREHFLFTNVTDKKNLIVRENDLTLKDSDYERGITPAILPILKNAVGAGFPNVVIDDDGVRRRISLLTEYEGAYVAQLVFAPVLGALQPDRIIREGNRLLLVNALDPADIESGRRKDISIPLDEDGRFVINWLKKRFIDADDPENQSFRHLSVYEFTYADELEDQLIEILNDILAYEIKNAEGYLSYHNAVQWLLAEYHDLQIWKQQLLENSRSDYFRYLSSRQDFFLSYGEFLDGGFDSEIYETFDYFAGITGNARYTILSENIQNNFEFYRQVYNAYQTQDAYLAEECGGSFCIIGYTGLGTSDLGINPFEKLYPNVGTHANIYNTIMTGEFIYTQPLWLSWILALSFCLISAVVYRKVKSLKVRISFGILSSLFVFFGIAILFMFFRIYIQMFVPLLSVFIAFLAISILRFVFSEKEKAFCGKLSQCICLQMLSMKLLMTRAV